LQAPGDHRIKEIVMAKVIEFYVPKHFRNPLKCVPQLQCGKVTEFHPQTKKSSISLPARLLNSSECNVLLLKFPDNDWLSYE
jgi:hypothetical protein